MIAAAVVAGWMLKDDGLFNPAEGLGYWLGIIGSTMMLFLLLYPVRKRIKFLRVFGPVKHWFKLHMILGLVGPLLVVYHCNYSLGSFNSRIALYCMLLVAISGVVGRHFYTRIHSGLYGCKIGLHELWDDLVDSLQDNCDMASLLPGLFAELREITAEIQGHDVSSAIGVRKSLSWTFKKFATRCRLERVARAELAELHEELSVVVNDVQQFGQSIEEYISEYVRLMGRVAQLSLYDRLFSWWHVLHMPLFFMLVLSAAVHVLAVHMY